MPTPQQIVENAKKRGMVKNSTIIPPSSGTAIQGPTNFGGLQGGIIGQGNLPQRTSVTDAYAQLEKIIPKPQPIAKLDANAFRPIQGLGNNYYTNLVDSASKRLNKQYFGDADSLQARLKNQMNQRGLIGSGIEAGETADLFSDFGSQLADIQSNVLTEKARNDLEVEKSNRDMAMKLATGNVDIDKSNRDSLSQFLNTLLAGAGDEARSQSGYAAQIYDYATRDKESSRETLQKQLDSLNQIIQNPDIDPETKQVFEDMLFNTIGQDPNSFGGTANLARDKYFSSKAKADQEKKKKKKQELFPMTDRPTTRQLLQGY